MNARQLDLIELSTLPATLVIAPATPVLAVRPAAAQRVVRAPKTRPTKRRSKQRSAVSLSDEWGTPQTLFEQLSARWHFDVDLAASALNAKVRRFITREVDALTQDWRAWGVSAFLNPPYSRGRLGRFMPAAREQALRTGGPSVVTVVPACTDTAWWHDAVLAPEGPLVSVTVPRPGVCRYRYERLVIEVEHCRGRLSFVGPEGLMDGARFPSAIVSFARPEAFRLAPGELRCLDLGRGER
jgi:hypothetical protein